MKKIIRLTESDLARIVRRVIKEQETTGGGYTQNAKTAIKLIEDGIAYWGGTDEKMIAKGVYAIKTKQDYNSVLDHCKKKGFKNVMAWINADWEYTPAASDSQFGLGSTEELNGMIMDIARHLKQFNPNESSSEYTTMGKSPGRTHNDGTFKSRN
jgi:hypothetical protein